jgi:hypothetical protein
VKERQLNSGPFFLKQPSTASARRAVSALFVGNGFAFGLWSVGSLAGVAGLRIAFALVVVAGAVISLSASNVPGAN